MTYPLVSESEFPQPPLIGTVADVAVTTSLEIARYFGKRHDNVLRDISNLQLSDFFRDLNYQASQYIVLKRLIVLKNSDCSILSRLTTLINVAENSRCTI